MSNSRKKTAEKFQQESFDTGKSHESFGQPADGREVTGLLLVGAAAALGFAAFWLSQRVVVSTPSQVIVKTGMGIRDMRIVRTAVRLPFQRAMTLSVAPRTITVHVDAMSRGRIPFRLPLMCTVAPSEDPVALQRFAKLMSEKGDHGLEETVAGIIQGLFSISSPCSY